MPLCLEPGATFDLWLPSDAAKPPESRPTFVGRALSVRDARQIMGFRQLVKEPEKADEIAMTDAVLAALSRSIVGWRHMGREFSAEALADVLTLKEAIELAALLAAGQSPTADELGNSGGPSPVGTTGSAPGAAAAADGPAKRA